MSSHFKEHPGFNADVTFSVEPVHNGYLLNIHRSWRHVKEVHTTFTDMMRSMARELNLCPLGESCNLHIIYKNIDPPIEPMADPIAEDTCQDLDSRTTTT